VARIVEIDAIGWWLIMAPLKPRSHTQR
jgi:hypothetical protein